MKTVPVGPEFVEKLEGFLKGLLAKCHAYEGEHLSNLSKSTFSFDDGVKYIRVVKEGPGGGGRYSFCFIDKSNGDVLKCDGWKKPAKHARGNIFNPDNGLDAVTVYGANYLK